MNRTVRLAVIFWWFALLDAGRTVQVIDRFLTSADCEWGRLVYARIIEESARHDRAVGPCQESA